MKDNEGVKKTNNLRETLKQVAISTNEVAEIMGSSKQGVINKVNRKELLPMKKTTQGMLFYREDIEKYLKKKQVIYSENVTTYQLGYILINNKNILVCGGVQSGKTYLINTVINKLRPSLSSFNKKINVRDLYKDGLNVSNKTINIVTEIDDTFFLHDKNVCGSIASIQATDEVNAIEEFALEIQQSVEYVLSKVDYVVIVDREYDKNSIIKTENIKKMIDNPNLCIYREVGELPLNTSYFTYFYE